MEIGIREFAKTMVSCAWSLGLFGTSQLAQVLAPPGVRQTGPPDGKACDTVTQATAAQLGALATEILQAGEYWQRGVVDLLFGMVTGDAATPRYLTKMTLEALRQSAAVGKWLLPGQENFLAWQELQNKLQAFSLFAHADVTLQPPAGPSRPLAALVAQTVVLEPYVRVWVLEGLGRYYAEMAWASCPRPQHLLTAAQVQDVPGWSVTPLHTGMGAALAERLLAHLTPACTDAAIDAVLRQFLALCQENARVGYRGAVQEALGLVLRLRHPQLLQRVDRRLTVLAPESLGYFWHGVGRGLYFLPLHALPWGGSIGQAIDLAHQEAPHTLGQHNALAGLAWPLTLVNIRHPAILETVLCRYSPILTAHEAFSTGVSTALLIWHDIVGSDPHLQAFLQHQPDPAPARRVQLWDSQVRQPSQQALHQYYGVLKAHDSLDEVFRYQPLAALVNRLRRRHSCASPSRS